MFLACRNGAGDMRLATRTMIVDGARMMLTVDPQTLATKLELAGCWTCAETTDAAQKDTRFLRSLAPAANALAPGAVSTRAGLAHGAGAGVYVTGDLCPSRKPLDRGFLETLARQGPHTPVALSVSGTWITRHGADFEWVGHSWRHPWLPRLPYAQNFLLRPGVDLDREIFDTERLLIARGETPSVFFRFPGLVADGALLDKLRAKHLIALGADSWLVLSPPPRPGSIVLVHPNGNEPGGLRLFSRMMDQGRMPKPFRRIEDAP